jgi:peptide/nickel transport system substrate-binding protein
MSSDTNSPPEGTLTRADFLRRAGGLGAAGLLASHGLLSASGAEAAVTPKRGGTLRAGISGGSPTETLDPQNLVVATDDPRAFCLFNGLSELDVNAQVVLMLAEEITPNATATEWTIRVKPGIEWHDGRTLSADDVAYSLQRVANPKSPLPDAWLIRALNTSAIKKLDARTVRIPCHYPFATLPTTLSQHNLSLVPVDFNPKKPVGTGAFKFKSFTPGVQSTFVRNPNYWETGLPYLDEVVLTDYADETSQVNALLGGQVDVIDYLSIASVATIQSGGGQVVISASGDFDPFTMRVDQAPFTDVRVRQAMRLIVDRPQMRELVFGGHGYLGNDVFSIIDPIYNHALPQRVQDIEQAKSLLKAAGHGSGLTVTMQTGNIAQGTLRAAQVFAQQATAAGVTVNLSNLPVSTFYGPNYTKWTFAQDYWPYYPYFDQVASSFLAGSPFNETHWTSASYGKLLQQAQGTLDVAKRTELAHELQMIDYTQGGYIIPYFAPMIDGHTKYVQGLVPCKTGFPLCNGRFKVFWLSK